MSEGTESGNQGTVESGSENQVQTDKPSGKIINGEWVKNENIPRQSGQTQGTKAGLKEAASEMESDVNGTGETEDSEEETEGTGGEFEIDDSDESPNENLVDLSTHEDVLKYKGQEIKVSYDEMKKLAQRGVQVAVALEQANVAKQTLGQYDTLMDNLKKDPRNVIEFAQKYLGHDLEKLIMGNQLERMETEFMTPEQKELHEARKFRAQWEAEQKEKEEKTKSEREAAEYEKVQGAVQREVMEFFGGMEVKPNSRVLSATFGFMIDALDRGQRLPIAKAFELAQARVKGQRQQDLTSLSVDELLELNPQLAEAVRAASLAKLRGNTRQTQPMRQSTDRGPQKTNQPKDQNQYFADLEKKYGKRN